MFNWLRSLDGEPSDEIPAALSFERLADKARPLVRRDAVSRRVGLDADTLQKGSQLTNAVFEVRPKDAAQRPVALRIVSNRPTHDDRQRERAGDAVDGAAVERDVV